MRIEISFPDFHTGPFHLKMGKLQGITPRLQAFIDETERAIGRKKLLFCNLDEYPDVANSPRHKDCLASVHDYPFYKVIYLRLSRNNELIVAHELGHICVSGEEADSWSISDLGFSSDWIPPALETFVSRTANLVSDVAANKRAHAHGFDVQPLIHLQLGCLVEDCQTIDLEAFPSRLDIVHRAAQLASTAIFHVFRPLTGEEDRCLKMVCDHYDRWHLDIRRLGKAAVDVMLKNGFEKRREVVTSIRAILKLLTDAFELHQGADAVRYDSEAFCIPEEVRERERAAPYAPARFFLRDDLRCKVALAERAQLRFTEDFLRGSEAEKLCCAAARCFQKGQFEAAENKAVAALKHDRRHPPTYHLLGRICRRRRDLDGAKRCFRVAVEKPVQFRRAYDDFAQTAFEAGDHQYTVSELTGLLNICKALWGHPRIHECLGRSLFELGDTKAAANAFKNVLLLEPDNRTVRQLLRNVELRLELEPAAGANGISAGQAKGEPHAHS